MALSRNARTDEQGWRNKFLWLPEIPSKGLLFNGAYGELEPFNNDIPVQIIFFEQQQQANGHARRLSQIWCVNYDICHIKVIHMDFDDGFVEGIGHEYPPGFGEAPSRYEENTGITNLGMNIDGAGGEEITGFEVQLDDEFVVGFAVSENMTLQETPSAWR